jgi:nucleotide-binding universal stress UspA family protein
MNARGNVDEIVVPLDLSERALAAFGPAGWLQQRTAARVVAVSAVRDPTHVEEAAERVRAQLPGDLGVVTELVVEQSLHPESLIVAVAGRSPRSVVCMATRGHGRISEEVLGSVARLVVERSERPILLVGPHVDTSAHDWTQIVACTDGSPASEPMLEVATEWAATFDLGLWFVNVRNPPRRSEPITTPTGTPAQPAPGDIGDTDLIGLARRHARPGLEPNWDSAYGTDAARAIVDYARTHPGSLLALGTHGRSGVSRLVLGSVAQRVVHDSPTPVLVVRGTSP